MVWGWRRVCKRVSTLYLNNVFERALDSDKRLTRNPFKTLHRGLKCHTVGPSAPSFPAGPIETLSKPVSRNWPLGPFPETELPKYHAATPSSKAEETHTPKAMSTVLPTIPCNAGLVLAREAKNHNSVTLKFYLNL